MQLPLDDIMLPPPVSAFPPAPGWWLLAVIILGLSTAAAIWAYRRWQRRRRLHQALIRLQQMTTGKQGSALCAAVNEWLKLCLRPYYPQALSLYGDDWLAFLQQHSGRQVFEPEEARALAHGPYRPDIAADATRLCQQAQHWLLASDIPARGGPQWN